MRASSHSGYAEPHSIFVKQIYTFMSMPLRASWFKERRSVQKNISGQGGITNRPKMTPPAATAGTALCHDTATTARACDSIRPFCPQGRMLSPMASDAMRQNIRPHTGRHQMINVGACRGQSAACLFCSRNRLATPISTTRDVCKECTTRAKRAASSRRTPYIIMATMMT